MKTDQHFVSLANAALRLGVHVSTVREWVRLGRVPAYRIGHRFVRIDWDEMLRAIKLAPDVRNVRVAELDVSSNTSTEGEQ